MIRAGWIWLALVTACSGKPDKPSDRAHDAASSVRLSDDMVSVPAGWFTSGCSRLFALELPKSASAPEGVTAAAFADAAQCVRDDPPRRLWISSFALDRLETTQEELAACAAAGKCTSPAMDWTNGRIRSVLTRFAKSEVHWPTVTTFAGAAAYCAWRGKRLPTEAEWEKAARGTDERLFPWGNAPATCARTFEPDRYYRGGSLHCRDGSDPRPVGQLPEGASFYGALDMHDNAAEWVSDWWNPSARRTRGEPRFAIEHRDDYAFLALDWSSISIALHDPAVVDPRGVPEAAPLPDYSPMHAAKGGSLHAGISGDHFGTYLVASSGENPKMTTEGYAGFRCARSVPGPQPPSVTPPAPDAFAPPFREPGYTPP